MGLEAAKLAFLSLIERDNSFLRQDNLFDIHLNDEDDFPALHIDIPALFTELKEKPIVSVLGCEYPGRQKVPPYEEAPSF